MAQAFWRRSLRLRPAAGGRGGGAVGGTVGGALLCALVLAATPVTAAVNNDPEIVREGVGSQRDEMDKLELAPFDTGLLTGLTSWENGEPLTAADVAGKPVVIFTWAHWIPASNAAVSIAQRLHDRLADEGLVVVGVHSEAGADGMSSFLERRKAAFPVAVDAGGKLRAALGTDQDPDFYLIDRAGQMRYADVQTMSVNAAADRLVGETSEAAAGTKDRMEQLRLQLERDARRTRLINDDARLDNLPEVPFEKPSSREYERQRWPSMPRSNRGNNNDENKIPRAFRVPVLRDRQGQPVPTDGRIVLLYFWTPALESTYRDVMPFADRLQEKHKRDVVVVGVMSAFTNDGRGGGREGMTAAQRDAAFVEFERAAERRHILFKDAFAASSSGGRQVSELLDQIDSGRTNWILPYAAIISSDGQLRWHGEVWSPDRVLGPLDIALRSDPGVRNRRAAEREYIRKLEEEQKKAQPGAEGASAPAQ